MAKVIVVIRNKQKEIISKAKYMDEDHVVRANGSNRVHDPFFIIPESEIDKYPAEIFSELKKESEIKPKKEKSK